MKALLRIAVVHNCPIACNRATADFLLASPLINEDYRPAASPGDLAPEERNIADIGLAVRG